MNFPEPKNSGPNPRGFRFLVVVVVVVVVVGGGGTNLVPAPGWPPPGRNPGYVPERGSKVFIDCCLVVI